MVALLPLALLLLVVRTGSMRVACYRGSAAWSDMGTKLSRLGLLLVSTHCTPRNWSGTYAEVWLQPKLSMTRLQQKHAVERLLLQAFCQPSKT